MLIGQMAYRRMLLCCVSWVYHNTALSVPHQQCCHHQLFDTGLLLICRVAGLPTPYVIQQTGYEPHFRCIMYDAPELIMIVCQGKPPVASLFTQLYPQPW